MCLNSSVCLQAVFCALGCHNENFFNSFTFFQKKFNPAALSIFSQNFKYIKLFLNSYSQICNVLLFKVYFFYVHIFQTLLDL